MRKFLPHIILLIALLSSCFTALGQEKCGIVGYVHELIGSLGESVLSYPVKAYDAKLIAGKDTLLYSSKDGDFFFRNLSPGPVKLIISKPGYLTFQDEIVLTEGDQTVTIELFRKNEELNSAIVSAIQPILTMKGDTLVFHANAVKRMEGDFAIDLISQMPGAEISDMGIKIGGKSVSRAYVNGVLVFGRNPMDAMRNLAAEEVISMNVYDEAPLESNIPTIKKERVINILTKNPILNVSDIQALVSGGADIKKNIDNKIQKRYIGGLTGQFFSESLLVKTDILTNNVGIDQSTMLGTDPFSTPSSALTSDAVKNAASVSVERYWGRNYNTRTGLNIKYSFSDVYTRSPQKSITDYFESDKTPGRTITDSTSNVVTNQVHTISTGFQKSFGGIRMNWSNDMNFIKSSNSKYAKRELSISGKTFNENSANSAQDNGWKIGEKLSFSGMSNDYLSSYSLSLDLKADKGDQTGFMIDTLKSSASQRYLEMDGNDLNWNSGINLSFTRYFKNAKHQDKITLTASTKYLSEKKIQTSLNLLDEIPSIDRFNTFDYTYKTVTNEVGLTFSRVYFQGGLRLSSSHLVDDERFPSPQQTVTRRYFSVIPYFYIFNGKTFDCSVNSNVILPSLEQVRQRVDNTNPLSVIAGNPNLKPGQTFNISISKHDKGSLVSNIIQITALLTKSPIVRRERVFSSQTELPEYGNYIMPEGSMLHTYDNADWAMTANATYSSVSSINFKKITPLRVNYSLTGSASVNPAYLIDDLYRINDLTGTGKMNMTYTANDKVRIIIGGNAAFTRNSNTINSTVINTIAWNCNLTVKYTPTEFAFIESSYNHNSRVLIQKSSSHSDNFLKVCIGTNLLSQRLKILLEGIDLLNNSNTYNTKYTENSLIQTFNPTFGKYLLLSIKYRFNSSQNKAFKSSFQNNNEPISLNRL